MDNKSHNKLRCKTLWDEETELTPTQQFLSMHYGVHSETRLPNVNETSEAELINSFLPLCCPYCGSEKFNKRGFTANRIQRYGCSCGQTFLPTTHTIFDGRKIAVIEWIEYCRNLIRYVSINADSWNDKNAFSTSQYWLKKLFLTLEDYQHNIILSGTVWLDETYYPVINSQIAHKDDGSKYPGLSQNQICIGAATDKQNTICFVEGIGKPSQQNGFQTFSSHIAHGSTLVHNKETTHQRLVSALNLISKDYSIREVKGLKDCDNPLEPVNDVHDRLKKFLNAHSGFNRDRLQDYLNLFVFMQNPPFDSLEKVEEVVHLAFRNPKLLRYREQFGINKRF